MIKFLKNFILKDFKVGRNVAEALLEYYRTLGVCEGQLNKDSNLVSAGRPIRLEVRRYHSSRFFEKRRHSAPLAQRTLTFLGKLEPPKSAKPRIVTTLRRPKSDKRRNNLLKRSNEYNHKKTGLTIIDFNKLTIIEESNTIKNRLNI